MGDFVGSRAEYIGCLGDSVDVMHDSVGDRVWFLCWHGQICIFQG